MHNKKNYTHLQSYELDHEKRQNFQITEYEEAIITNQVLYKNDGFYVLIPMSESRKTSIIPF